MTRFMLYTERRAYARMSPRRQALHRLISRIYYAFPFGHNLSAPHVRAWMALWRLYRRTWPR